MLKSLLLPQDSDPAALYIIHVCIVVIIVCLLSAFIVALSLFIARFRSTRGDKRNAKLEDQYGLLLTEIIAYDTQMYTEYVQRFKQQWFTPRSHKQVLRKQLLLLHKNLSGHTQDILRQLYYDLGLHREALRQLQKTDWSEKAGAIKELGQMEYLEAKKKIFRLTTHENPVLRLEAQTAMLSIDKENPFGFLEVAKADISEWQQLNLEEMIKGMQLDFIPVFSKWFKMRNQSVVQFAIKMTVMFNQFESARQLIDLTQTKDERVVREAVKAIGTMLVFEAQDTLIELYPDVIHSIKKEILVSLGKIGGESTLAFLAGVVKNEPYDLAMTAGRALKDAGVDGFTLLEQLTTSEDELAQAIANHMLDERI